MRTRGCFTNSVPAYFVRGESGKVDKTVALGKSLEEHVGLDRPGVIRSANFGKLVRYFFRIEGQEFRFDLPLGIGANRWRNSLRNAGLKGFGMRDLRHQCLTETAESDILLTRSCPWLVTSEKMLRYLVPGFSIGLALRSGKSALSTMSKW